MRSLPGNAIRIPRTTTTTVETVTKTDYSGDRDDVDGTQC